MIIRSSFFGASIFFLAFYNIALAGDAATPASCGLKRVESYKMFSDHYGHALINFMMDRPRRFLVDTGGIGNSIYSSVAADMKLSAQKNPYATEVGVNGDRYESTVTIPSYTIGIITFTGANFLVVPDEPWATEASIAGTLAPITLSLFDVEFDFSHDRMNLFSSDHCPGKVVYWANEYAAIPFKLNGGHIEIEASLEGRPIIATLDTGSPDTVLSMSVAKRVFGLDGTSDGVSAAGKLSEPDNEKDRVYARYFNSLSLGGIEIRNPHILLVPDKVSAATHGRAELPQLILGLHELLALHFYVAYHERMIYVTSANAGFPQATAQPPASKN